MADRRGAFIGDEQMQPLKEAVVVPVALDADAVAQFLLRDFAIRFAVFGKIVVQAQQGLLLRVLKFKYLHRPLLIDHPYQTGSNIASGCVANSPMVGSTKRR